MATTGMSDNDLVKLASKYYESKYAVPEKTTWDYIQEDIDKWQTAVKGRAAKFMQDLPEEFDLNKVEPQGRDAISKWYKDMRTEYMDAANKASLFDPGSFAYGDGTSKMNKIEDNMDAVSGIFDNIKKVRTESIANEGKSSSRIPEDQKGLIEAVKSGQIFENMNIKTDGSVTFTVPGYIDEETGKDKVFTDEDIKTLPIKGFKAESAYNGVVAAGAEYMSNGIGWGPRISTSLRQATVSALNSGKETGEQMDMMFDVAGSDLKDPKPYVAQYIKNTFGHEMGDGDITTGSTKQYKEELKKIRGNISDFYNENEDDFIDNFLMKNVQEVHKNTKPSEKTLQDLRKFEADVKYKEALIAKTRSEIKTKDNSKIDLPEQATIANSVLADGGRTFNYDGWSVSPNDAGGYNVKKGEISKFFGNDAEGLTNMRGLIGLVEAPEVVALRKKQAELRKKDLIISRDLLGSSVSTKSGGGTWDFNSDAAKVKKTLYDNYRSAFAEGPVETIAFLEKAFNNGSVVANRVGSSDNIKITINGETNTFMTNPYALGSMSSREARANAMLQWISDRLKN